MCDRENSLEEWCERLIPSHRVNKELAALKSKVANDSASHNKARDAIALVKMVARYHGKHEVYAWFKYNKRKIDSVAQQHP